MLALLVLLPAVLFALMLAYMSVNPRIWTWPPRAILRVVVFCILLGPPTWVSVPSILNFVLFWDGSTRLYREGRFLVFQRLVWGKGFPHRTDIGRLSGLSVSIARYPRDETDRDWRPSFRPRVLVRNGSSRVLALGEGLTLHEAESLAASVGELIGVPVA